MSTIASLLSMLNPLESQERAERIEHTRQLTDTGLLELAERKRQQAAEQEMWARIKQDPELQQQLFGGSVLGGLGPAGAPGGMPGGPGGGPPGGGPMTQQQVMPGQPPGAPQVVPGGQDLSRFATQGGPPQSTIASLGPQPQGPPQGQMPSPQRNPLIEMAATNPRAAFMLQKQMEAQQDLQWKNEERRLDMGVKVAAAVAQELNAVKDQPTLDAARERIRLYHPQAAAQIPQFYSKEALEPLIMKGVAVEKLAGWRKDMATARQTEMMTERLPQVFGALQQFATGGGGTTEPPAGTTTTTAAPTTTRGTVPGTAHLSPQFQTKAQGIADRLDANVDDLYRVMSFETGGEMSPATRNRAGSGATGLIQFTPETAKGLGTTTEALAKMTPEQQLDYVEKYLAPYKGKIGTLKDLYLAVLYPAALGKSEDTVLFSPDKTPAAYRQNAGLDTGQKGYVTVGDAVAAVERTTGGGGRGTATTGGTGTAQAPKADPKIAQLDTRIKQGQALALQLSAVPGMESAATMVNQQVNDLQKERDRLDAPRQDFLKKQAVQGLELEQKEREGLARAQLEADTKPATNAEIDAINRALPREKQLSYGTTYKEIREKKLVGGAPLDTKITEGLTATTTAIQQFEELSNAVTALPTGPLTQYVEQFKERWGIDISDEKVAQRAILAGAQNQLLQARNGAAIAPHEYERLMKELPNEGLDPKVFKARLANTVRQFKNAYKTKVQILRKTGHAIPDDLMEPLPAPEAPPAPKVSSNVDKFKGIKP